MEDLEIKLLENSLDKMVAFPEFSVIVQLPSEHVMDAVPYSIKECKCKC